jgi:hypothetical protein
VAGLGLLAEHGEPLVQVEGDGAEAGCFSFGPVGAAVFVVEVGFAGAGPAGSDPDGVVVVPVDGPVPADDGDSGGCGGADDDAGGERQ